MRFDKLLAWAERQKDPTTSADLDLLDEIENAENLSQMVYTSLDFYTGMGTEAHTVVENTKKGSNGAEAWRKLALQFDPPRNRRTSR